MNKRSINKAIKNLGLTIEGLRGDGCFYFIDTEGYQIGKTIYVCYLNQLSLERWQLEAVQAKSYGRL